jgi:hypothetical protein
MLNSEILRQWQSCHVRSYAIRANHKTFVSAIRGGKVSFAFVKNVVQIAFFYDCNYFSLRKHKKCPLSGGKVP